MLPQRRRSTNAHDFDRASNSLPVTAKGMPAFQPQQQYDPRALLDPRGLGAAQPRPAANSFTSKPQPQPAQVFSFDSPSGTPQPVSHAPPALNGQEPQKRASTTDSNGNGNGFAAYAGDSQTNGGMGSMLDSLYKVTDRSMVPQKRRKLVDDREENHKKAEFSGGQKSGPLGEYMREKRQEGQSEAMVNGSAPVTIDDDDDEVVILQDSGDKEVCYGRGTHIPSNFSNSS